MWKTLIFAIFAIVESFKGASQCTPIYANRCTSTTVLCSLESLNGFACSKLGTEPSQCSPLCSTGSIGDNTAWWAFLGDSGEATIKLIVGNCSKGQGLEWGIWGSCSCTDEVLCHANPCIAPNHIDSAQILNLEPCKVYYLWIDGCSADVCDFTLQISGGHGPSMEPLGYINRDTGRVIPVCAGAANQNFFIDPPLSSCPINYLWTLDGDELGESSNSLNLGFPDEGDFIICVKPYLANQQIGDLCKLQEQRCATIRVRKIPDFHGKDRIICRELAQPGGFKWHGQRVFNSGQYRQQFSEGHGCIYDSVVNFIVLDSPVPPEVFYLTCDDKPYVDLTGKTWDGCQNLLEIPLPKSTRPFACDSSILLTAVHVNLSAEIKSKYMKDTLTYDPMVRITEPCNVGETYAFNYQWRESNDSLNTILSTDELFKPAEPGDYVLDVFLKCHLGNDSIVCKTTHYETFNELQLIDGPRILSSKAVCPNDTTWAYVQYGWRNTILQYAWEVQGGNIISQPDSDAIQVVWNILPGEQAFLRVVIKVDSFETLPATCEIHTIQMPGLRKDFSVFGKLARLETNSHLKGSWTMISGPSTAFLDDPNASKTYATVESFGTYCFAWHAQLPDCEESDTVCVRYKDITTYEDQEEKKHEKGDSLKSVLVNRMSGSNGISLVNITKKHAVFYFKNVPTNKPEFEWIALNGKNFSVNGMDSRFDGNFLSVEKPEVLGLYVLNIKTELENVQFKLFLKNE